MRILSVLCIIHILFLCMTARQCLAHDPGLSSANITIGASEVSVQLQFAPGDMETMGDFSDKKALVAQWQIGGEEIEPASSNMRHNVGDNVEFLLMYPRGAEQGAIFRSLLLDNLPRGHRQLLSVRNLAGELLEPARLLSSESNSAQLSFPGTSGTTTQDTARPTFAAFVLLGIEHILTGYDHLIFLFALLLVCVKFRSFLIVATVFTIAHSITLALATFNLVTLPGSLVEPLIAASIIWIGVENLLFGSRPIRWRLGLTFAFGLIHGLGFASLLRDLGVGSDGQGVALPLFSFNLGVELGQIAVAGVLFPVLHLFRKGLTFRRYSVQIGSAAAVCAGIYWIIDRTIS